jgi:hypothetical protein
VSHSAITAAVEGTLNIITSTITTNTNTNTNNNNSGGRGKKGGRNYPDDATINSQDMGSISSNMY